jgi:UDPglucose 6-dehydrogenase
MLESIYRSMCDNRPVVQRMNFVNAELTKIAVNTYVTTKISFANMISDLCDRLPGADAATVTAALGCDTRIGGKYLRPGLGYGGPCFPRDNAALAAIARQMRRRARPPLACTWDRRNSGSVVQTKHRRGGGKPSY